MMQLEHVHAAYGKINALRGVSLSIEAGKVVAIVGPNGAGKSTLFRVISGVVPATGGSITFEGDDLLRLPASVRAFRGIAHVPEGRQVFKTMTVAENVELGAYALPTKARKKRAVERSLSLFPRLRERHSQKAGTLSGGEQQMLAIGRALACDPKLLLLDEPSMGLSPLIADNMFESIKEIRRQLALTIVLVEQRVAEALTTCDWGYVIDTGSIVLEGSPDTLLSDARVKNVYMGHR
jgi:branched-chain amino acid transport system ATP-binding protein